MGNIGKVYRDKFARKLRQFNVPMKLPDYFAPMIGEKKAVTIAEVAAGPINTIGNLWPDVEVHVIASDIMWPEYEQLWREHGAVPVVPVIYGDFEHLTYEDNTFDIVHCVNALDHTGNPLAALDELHRICKPGGWIYLRHAPDQMKRYGGHHQWNVSIENGQCKFQGKEASFYLTGFTLFQEGDLIVAICQKT